MAGVTLENLSFRFGDNVIFEDFSLEVRDGEILGIVGPSGCGKTTLARCIAGLINPDKGSVKVGERVLFDRAHRRNIPPEQRRIGMVFQDYAVWPHKTVYKNVEYPLLRRKVPKEERAPRVNEAIRQVQMEPYKKHLPSQLSGGQQQRVAIARALVASDDLIILDEPITNLDAKLREEMIIEIQLLQKNLGTTIIYITHDQETALKLCDRICIMNREGAIEQIAEDEEIILRPASRFVFEFIGVSNFVTVERTGDQLIYHRPDGQHKAPGAELEKLDEGVLYDMGVRPLNILFDEESPLRGIVERRTFLGDQYNYFIDFGGQQLRVEMNALDAITKHLPAEGEEVGLVFLRPFYYPHKSTKEEVLSHDEASA